MIINETKNEVNLTGYIRGLPELKKTGGGASVFKFKLETYIFLKGDDKKIYELHDCRIFGDFGEEASLEIKPGYLIDLTGRKQTNSWKEPETGLIIRSVEIIVQEYEVMDGYDMSQKMTDEQPVSNENRSVMSYFRGGK